MRQDRQSRWPAWAWVGAVAIVLAYVLLGGLFPDADPTGWLPGDLADRVDEFLVEGPAKAHEARNWALFGEFHRNPADNYQFWRAQAPVWVYPLAGVFRVFGVNYVTLRFFTLFFGTTGLILTLVVLGRTVPPWAALGAGLLYTTNVFSTFLSRSGLIEVFLNAASVLMVLVLLPARRHPGWLVASQLVFTIGFFGKQGMIYLFPLLVIVNALVFLHWRRSGAFPRLRWLPVLTAVGFAVVAVLVIAQPEYQRAITWNANHLLLGRQGANPSGSGFWMRLDGLRLWRTFVLLTPVIGTFAVPGAIWLLIDRLRAGSLDWRTAVLLGWASSAWLAALGPHVFTLRHASIVLLPNVIVIALVAAHLQRSSRRSLLPLFAAVAGLTLALHTAYQVRRYEEMTWERQAAVRRITAKLGDEPAVIIGRHAMPMLLATPYDLFYVKLRFNTAPERLKALRPTHILLSRKDSTHKVVIKAEPDIALGSSITHARMNDHTMKLIPVKWPDER